MKPANFTEKIKSFLKGPHNFRLYIKSLWIIYGAGFFLFVAFIVAVGLGFWGEMPDPAKLEEEIMGINKASIIYDARGEVLGKYFVDNRSLATYDELGDNLTDALVATEEIRFYSNSGIDLKGLLSTAYYLLKGSRRGSSTLSQQLAKNLFKRDDLFIGIVKVKEMIMATWIERMYTKKEVMTLYLNLVEYPYNSWGVKSASKTFFNKTPKELELQEAAVMVGMLKGPSIYNPITNPNDGLRRRNTVLNQMEKYEYITEAECDTLKATPIETNLTLTDHTTGIATYFRSELAKTLKVWCKNNGYNLYTDGLKIYTTIDGKMQKYAEEGLKEHFSALQPQLRANLKRQKIWSKPAAQRALKRKMKESSRYQSLKSKGYSEAKIKASFEEKRNMKVFFWEGYKEVNWTPMDSLKHYITFLQTGFLALDPNTGFVRAWVGGANFKHFKYDHIYKKRQCGSTFKPIVYAWDIAQLNNEPCEELGNMSVIFDEKKWNLGSDWIPKNSGHKTSFSIAKKNALRKSLNIPTASLLNRVGPDCLDSAKESSLVKFASNLGLEVEAKPSICLGVSNISVAEMAPVYSTFSNGGVWNEPQYLVKIADNKGNVLEAFTNERREVMNEMLGAKMTELMQGTAEPGGTAYRLRSRYGFKGELAGKTATTNDHMDGWFMAVLPKLTIGVWTGCDEPVFHFNNISQGQGANMALPLAALLMKKLYNDPKSGIKPTDTFKFPKGYVALGCPDEVGEEERQQEEQPVVDDNILLK